MMDIYENMFILAKLKEDWTECRVLEIKPALAEGDRLLRLFQMNENRELPDLVPESLVFLSTQDSYKKNKYPQKGLKLHLFTKICRLLNQNIHSDVGIEVTNRNNVSTILKEFIQYLSTNNKSISNEELEELEKGLVSIFNRRLYKFLLYDHEVPEYLHKVGRNLDRCVEVYGLIHLVRLVYFLKVSEETRVFEFLDEYLVVFCDFLEHNMDKYT